MPDTLVVAAGCRGVGTSFVAGMAALAAWRQGKSVLLLDAVDGEGTQHGLFAVHPQGNLWDLAGRQTLPLVVAIAIDHQFTLVAGATRDTTQPPLSGTARRVALRRIADAFAHVDLIVVDGGSMLDAVRAATEALDAELLLVTSSDRVTMAASHALAKVVRLTHPHRRISVAANRDTRGLDTCKQLNTAAARFPGSPLLVAGSVPDDRAVHAALRAGFPLIDAAEDSIAIIAVTGILAARATRPEHTVGSPTAAPFIALSRGRS